MDLSLFGFSGLVKAYNVHPAFVHFPVALIPTALLFYVIGTSVRSRTFFVAGKATLVLALFATIVTVITGLFAEDTFEHSEVVHQLIETHEAVGFVTLALTLILTVWAFVQREQRPKGLAAFLVVLLLGAYLAIQNGDIGGRMVYLHGAGVKPAALPKDGAKNQEDAHDHESGHHGAHAH